MRRRPIVLLGTAVLAAVAAGAGAPAGALDGEPITFVTAEGSAFERTYDDGMVGSDSGHLFTDPDSCSLVTTCTRITIDFVEPEGADPDADFVVPIAVAWPTVDFENDVQNIQSNDLDVYLWQLRPVLDEDGEPEVDEEGEPVMQYEEVLNAASDSQPEVMRMFSPRGTYELTVVNWNGVNTEFTVSLGFEDRSFVVPDFGGSGPAQSPAPGPAAPAVSEEAPDDGSRLALGGTPAPPVDISPPAVPTLPGLTPLDDDDGFGVAGGDDLDDLLAGDTRGSLFDQQALGPPEPVSAATAGLWLGLMPLLLLALAGGLFLRFRPRAMSFRLPGAPAAVENEA